MDALALFTFVAVSLVGIATPGPDVVLAMNNGIRHGLGKAVIGIAGTVLSDVLLIATVGLGLGTLLATSGTAFHLVRIFGIFYLGWVGIGMLVSKPPQLIEAADRRVVPARALFVRSFLVAVSNVKVWLFLISFLPQFINPDRPSLPQYLMLGTILEVMTFAVLLGYAGLGNAALKLLDGRLTHWMERGSGLVLVLMACGLVIYVPTFG